MGKEKLRLAVIFTLPVLKSDSLEGVNARNLMSMEQVCVGYKPHLTIHIFSQHNVVC